MSNGLEKERGTSDAVPASAPGEISASLGMGDRGDFFSSAVRKSVVVLGPLPTHLATLYGIIPQR